MSRSFHALVSHFFGRFFDVDSVETDAWTRIIQLLALLSVPGLMISFFMMSDHPAGAMFVRGAFSEADRLWLRVGDHYVFVAYGIVVMGLLMTMKWDSLFPDRRDYLILTSLPISSRRWFAAKVLALCGFLCLFAVAINLFSLLLVPTLLAEQSKVRFPDAFPQALLAHAAGTAGGSIFAALFFAAVQGVLINVLSADAFRRISPRIQMISIAALVTLLLITPLIKDTIPTLAKNESPLLALLAVFEFEYFNPALALFHLVFDLVLSAFLIDAFFFRFNKVPFTCSYTRNKFQLVAVAAAYLYGFTTYIGIAVNLKRAFTSGPLFMAMFLFIAAALFAVLRKIERGSRVVYQEDEAALLSLSADIGYWRAPQASRPRRSFSFNPKTIDVSAILNDLRYGARILWKSPWLSGTAVVLIALVIGLNTTIYSIVHALITRPAPVVRAKNLVVLGTPATPAEPFHSYPEYLDFAGQTKTLERLIGYGPEPITFGTRDGTYGFFGSYATPNYFDGLGVHLLAVTSLAACYMPALRASRIDPLAALRYE